MNYKIMRLAGLGYDSFKANLTNLLKEKNITSYDEIKREIFNNFYVYADSFSYGMNSIGNSACECLYDFKPLQVAWAKEHGISYNENAWPSEIALAQIKHFQPDVLYFQDIHGLPLNVKLNLKKTFPFLKALVLFRGWPGGDAHVYQREFKFADIIFAGSPILLEKIKQTDLIKPILMHHSFDPRILDKIKGEKKYDFTFIGTTGYKQGGHSARYWTLLELLKKTNLELWAQEYSWATDSYNRHLNVTQYLNQDYTPMAFVEYNENHVKNPIYPLSFLFPDRCHGSDSAYDVCFGLKMYEILKKSKITFNRHCNDARDEWDNMRMFQATGVGTCMLVEHAKNMSQLFEADKEVMTYQSVDECIEKAKYLLEHNEECQTIAEAGQRRTLKDHTISIRCQEMHEIIKKII